GNVACRPVGGNVACRLADGCCDEAGELCTVEARSADQPAVYVWLLHQLADGFPLHGAAVEDPDASGDLLPSQLSERLADRGADLLRIRGGGDLAGADGPDGLVGEHDLGELFPTEAGKRCLELVDDVAHVLGRLTNLQRLADADDRGQTMLERGTRLRSDRRIVLTVVLTAFRVTDDREAATQLREHRTGDLTGVRAGVVGRDVLGAIADLQLVTLDDRLHGADVGERRQNRDVDSLVVLLRQSEGKLLHHLDRLEVVEVHLPIARDQGLALDGAVSCHSRILSVTSPAPGPGAGNRRVAARYFGLTQYLDARQGLALQE